MVLGAGSDVQIFAPTPTNRNRVLQGVIEQAHGDYTYDVRLGKGKGKDKVKNKGKNKGKPPLGAGKLLKDVTASRLRLIKSDSGSTKSGEGRLPFEAVRALKPFICARRGAKPDGSGWYSLNDTLHDWEEALRAMDVSLAGDNSGAARTARKAELSARKAERLRLEALLGVRSLRSLVSLAGLDAATAMDTHCAGRPSASQLSAAAVGGCCTRVLGGLGVLFGACSISGMAPLALQLRAVLRVSVRLLFAVYSQDYGRSQCHNVSRCRQYGHRQQ